MVRSTAWKDGEQSGTLAAIIEWRDPKGKTLLVENRNMTFYVERDKRTMDFQITLTAAVDVTFGDTKEGAFAIRLADQFTERKGGKMVDAAGRVGMLKVWGKRSNWVDYTAEVDGERLGVAMFDHPKNPNHPTYWHARDYGLFSLNPFGQNAFDPDAEERRTKLATGQKLEYRWRVVIHSGDAASGHVAEMYRAYVSH